MKQVKNDDWKTLIINTLFEMSVTNNVLSSTSARLLRLSLIDSINESKMMDDTRKRTGGKVSGINVLGE